MLDLTNIDWNELSKRPAPTNEGLNALFAGVDVVTIKNGGVHNEKAMSNDVALTLDRPQDVAKFREALTIDEEKIGFHCMCLGDYALELKSGDQIKATIGFHHGISIRCAQWSSDAELADGYRLLNFLAEKGLTEPLAARIEDDRQAEFDRSQGAKWLENAPPCFTRYWEQMNGFESDYLPLLVADLNAEFPDRDERLQKLLQAFGRSDSFWTGFPTYESVPAEILKTYEFREIIEAYERSNKNYKIRLGLGRYICSFDFGKVRKKHLHLISDETIEALERVFKAFKVENGVERLQRLKEEKRADGNSL